MNTEKAKRILKKVQALFDNLSDQGTISTLERDLLLSYLREFYDEISSSAAPLTHVQETLDDPVQRKMDIPAVKPATPAHQSSASWNEPPKPVTPEPVHTRVERIVPPVQQPVENFAPAHESMSVMYNTAPTGQHETDAALIALFEFKEVGELAEKLKLQPLERIEHGMGINERILTINELFGGDSELFGKTVESLNSLKTFKDAQSLLTNGVASRFNWADEPRKKKAAYFIEIVRRRYVNPN